VVLTDFGISKAVEGTTQLTGTGTIIGTPQYMAPEQAKGREVDGRTDQYALAIVGYRALTGELPFEGDAHSILYQQVHEQPPRVLDRRPDTPLDLRVALDRALAKDSNARFKTMEQFAAAVSGERSDPTTVVSKPVRAAGPVKPGKPADDHGAGVYVALATVAAVAVAAWLAIAGFPPIVQQSLASRSAPAREVVTPPVSKPATSRPIRRRPVASVSPSPEKRRGPAKLKPVQHVLLKVYSDPRGVLYVDGVRVGLTPVTNHRLSRGSHRLRIEQKGYQSLTENIMVKGTGPVIRRYDLRRRRGR
jgi:serine/threonine-protein kinase